MENISWTDRAKLLTGGNNLGILQKKRWPQRSKGEAMKLMVERQFTKDPYYNRSIRMVNVYNLV